jgi:hypothetical protein
VHLRHPRPRDVVIAELKMLSKARRDLLTQIGHANGQITAITERMTRLLDDLLEARNQEQR